MEHREIAAIVEKYYGTVLFPLLGEAVDTTQRVTVGVLEILDRYDSVPFQEEGEKYVYQIMYGILGQTNLAEQLTIGLIKIIQKSSPRFN